MAQTAELMGLNLLVETSNKARHFGEYKLSWAWHRTTLGGRTYRMIIHGKVREAFKFSDKERIKSRRIYT